jgi:hypothetical protein
MRPRFPQIGPVLLCDESCIVMAFGTIRNRLAYLPAARGPVGRGAVLAAQRCAGRARRRNYEPGVELVAIQQILGHWHVGATMRYVQLSSTFVDDASVRAI